MTKHSNRSLCIPFSFKLWVLIKNVDYLQPLSFSVEFFVCEKPTPISLYVMLIYPCLWTHSFGHVFIQFLRQGHIIQMGFVMNLWILPASFSLALMLQSCKTAPELFCTIKYSSSSSKVELNYVSHHILNDQLFVILLIFTNFVVVKHTWTREIQVYTPPHTHTPNTQIFLTIHSFMCIFLQGPLLVKCWLLSLQKSP